MVKAQPRAELTEILRLVFLIGLSVFVLVQQARAQDAGQRRLEPEAATAALNAFKTALDQRWSYRLVNHADFDTQIKKLHKRVESARGITQNELGIELQRIIALGIDGHSGVSGFTFPAGGRLPFLIEVSGERFVAVDSQRKGFLAEGFPFITGIDGRTLQEWCAAASVLVVKGSPQYIRHRSLNLLRELDYWREIMKLPKKSTVEVELTDNAGTAKKILTLPIAASNPSYGVWPSKGSRLLEEENIGYLRLPNMRTSTSVPEIKTWMAKFRDTAGLIIDVRDNNGGDRDPLLMLYSYLAAPDDSPRVFNAAAYRLHSAHPSDHLAKNHRMYRINAAEWSSEQKAAVLAFAQHFKPQWKLPRGQFSDWHYMALTRIKEPDFYHYIRPVIVLMNGKSFSATDVFLAGLKGMKNIQLLGTPSSGGSAFTQEIRLSETLTLRIGSMVSFQADGKLFDGNGIRPDVLVEPVPEYFIGGRDNQLEEAMKWIKGTKRRTH